MNDATQPTAGFYRMRMAKGGPLVGVRLWHGPPLDPWTREPMDRGARWNAEMNGRFVDVERVWPVCLADPINRESYDELCQLQDGAMDAGDAYSAHATPTKATDWSTATPPSFE